ncbi:hypothetical protein [Sorangium sp. So ce233]|uniref:hypothetical protein n=1 Tax=Sorangium sp. So ce233 TaxID=3133290 RepID=UPI003F5F09B5
MGTGTEKSSETTTDDASAALNIRSVDAPAAACQTPPDVKITVLRGADVVLKVASIGGQQRGVYQAEREYWRQGVNVDSYATSDLELHCSELTKGAQNAQTEIDDFLKGCASAFAHKRPVSRDDWRLGERAIPSNRSGYLFSSPSPDSSQIHVGLLIEVDKLTRTVVSTTWYRSTVPESNRYQIWNATKFELVLKPVQVNGKATTNPRAIPGYGTAAWHYTTMGSP